MNYIYKHASQVNFLHFLLPPPLFCRKRLICQINIWHPISYSSPLPSFREEDEHVHLSPSLSPSPSPSLCLLFSSLLPLLLRLLSCLEEEEEEMSPPMFIVDLSFIFTRIYLQDNESEYLMPNNDATCAPFSICLLFSFLLSTYIHSLYIYICIYI